MTWLSERPGRGLLVLPGLPDRKDLPALPGRRGIQEQPAPLALPAPLAPLDRREIRAQRAPLVQRGLPARLVQREWLAPPALQELQDRSDLPGPPGRLDLRTRRSAR